MHVIVNIWDHISEIFSDNSLHILCTMCMYVYMCVCKYVGICHTSMWKRRRKKQPTPIFLPGKSHGQRSLWATVHRDHKEADTTGQLLHTYIHTHSCRYMHIHTYICTCTHIHMHIYIYKCHKKFIINMKSRSNVLKNA